MEHFAAAVKAIAKALPARSTERIAVHLGIKEARFSVATGAALVRLHAGTFPGFDHVFSRTEGQRWVPCASSLAPELVTAAQQIAGKPALCFFTPVQANSQVPRLWDPIKADREATVPLSDVQALVRDPAYWTDSTLALLVMPINRPADERQLDFSIFTGSKSPAVGVAA